MVFLWLEGRGGPQVLRPGQRVRRLVRQEGQPAEHGAFDGETRRVGGAGHAVRSLAGENVLDLFGGSGSTLIAAEQTGRQAFLMELDDSYCDVIVQRLEKFTGRKARADHGGGHQGPRTPENTPAVAAAGVEGGPG